MNECVNVTQQIWCSLFDREKDLMNSEQRVQWYARLNKIDSKQRQTNIDAAHCLWWPRTRVNLKCMKLYSSLRGIRALNTASWKLYSWMIYKLTSGSDSFRLHQLWTRMAYVFTLVLINSNNCRCGTSKIQNNNQNNGCQFETYDWIVFHPKIIRYCDRIFYNHLSIREFEKKNSHIFHFDHWIDMCSARNNSHCDSFPPFNTTFSLSSIPTVFESMFIQTLCIRRQRLPESELFIHKHKWKIKK